MLNKYTFIPVLWAACIVTSVATVIRAPSLPLGVSEIIGSFLIFIYLMKFVFHVKLKSKVLFDSSSMLLGVLFLSFLVVGSYHSIIMGTASLAFRDMFAYIYCFFLMAAFTGWLLEGGAKMKMKRFLFCVSLLGFFYCFIIEILSYRYLELWYQGFRLSGFSKNPNQFSLLVLLLINVTVINVYISQSLKVKFLHGFFCVFLLYISLKIRSDALILSIVFSYLIAVIYTIISAKNMLLFKWISILVLFKFILVIFILNVSSIVYYWGVFFELLNEGGQGDDRLTLWKNAVAALLQSPLYGNGPGAHSGHFKPFESSEAHNTYLDFASQTGFLGLIMLVFAYFKAFSISFLLRKNYMVFYMTSSLVVGAFHFYMRQPIYWFMILLPFLLYRYCVIQNEDSEQCAE